jgi:hypothetical protein
LDGISEAQIVPQIREVITDKVLFQSICRPFVLKTNATGKWEWFKLSRCVIEIRQIQEKTSFSLLIENTHRVLVNALIHAGTTFQTVGPKRLEITLQEGQQIFRYIIQVPSINGLSELHHLLISRRSQACKILINTIRTSLSINTCQPFKQDDGFVRSSYYYISKIRITKLY